MYNIKSQVGSFHTKRLFHALNGVKAGASSISFIPTGSVLGHQSHEAKLQESEAAVPNKPLVGPVFRIYRDMVKPEDACDLLWSPKFEDYLTSGLAKECPLLGDTSFKVISKSPVHESNMMFANIAISWLDRYKKQVFELKDMQTVTGEISYTNFSPSLKQQFSEAKLVTQKDTQKFLDGMLAKGFVLEAVIQYSLSRDGTEQMYEMTMKYVTQNVKSLNPSLLSNFIGYLVNDAFNRIRQSEPSKTAQLSDLKVAQIFDQMFSGKLLKEVPGVLSQLNVSTLDKLSCICSVSGNFTTAQSSLTEMTQRYKIAPSHSTWETFVTMFREHAAVNSLSKSDIVTSLVALKPVIFHHPVTPSLYDLLLNHVVDNVHDLSHLVQLAQKSAPGLLREKEGETIRKLEEISGNSKSETPRVFDQVRLSQLKKFLAREYS